MAMNQNIRMLQITIRVKEGTNPAEIRIHADEDRDKNPAAADFQTVGIKGQHQDVLKDLVSMLESTYPSNNPISLCIVGKQIRARSECSP
jgi:hypothetical protein